MHPMHPKPAQLSLLEREALPSLPPKRPPLQGAELELAMRRVWVGWQRWHRCAGFEQAVADPLTRRLLALAANRGPLRLPGEGF